jgi:hypothetical protein
MLAHSVRLVSDMARGKAVGALMIKLLVDEFAMFTKDAPDYVRVMYPSARAQCFSLRSRG